MYFNFREMVSQVANHALAPSDIEMPSRYPEYIGEEEASFGHSLIAGSKSCVRVVTISILQKQLTPKQHQSRLRSINSILLPLAFHIIGLPKP